MTFKFKCLMALCFVPSTAFAGVRIDLRPTQPVPPGGYQPNADVQVDAFLVDTGNPQGNIMFRGIFLDFTDSSSSFTYLDPTVPGDIFGPNEFAWAMTWPLDSGFYNLPQTSWVYPLPTANPLFQYVLPNNGEVHLGHLILDVGATGGTLDALNDDVADANFGARVDFGFGGAGDPITTWRAFTGEVTGGVLELPVIPEPTTCLLLVLAASALFIPGKAVR